jgi:hypothetical protein
VVERGRHLGPGPGTGSALLLDPAGDSSWVGGLFVEAGGEPSIGIARWSFGDPFVGKLFCFGDVNALCPCGNDVEGGGGCANSTGAGARLEGSGSEGVAANGLSLRTEGLPPSASSLLFAGYATHWTPLTMGNGRRCIAGALRRIAPVRQTNASGEVVRTQFIGNANAVLPGNAQITAGTTWHFQDWYRDVNGACGSTFNFSNGLSESFLP